MVGSDIDNDADPMGVELTAVTMGIDALERRRPPEGGLLDQEGLVPIYVGHDIVAARDYADWQQVEADLQALTARLDSVSPRYRQLCLSDLLRSLKVAVRLFAGASPSFEEKVRDLVGAPTGAVEESVIATIRDRLDTLLRQKGVVRGTLAERIGEWEHSGALEPGRLEAAFEALMHEARARTAATIFDCGDFTMSLNPVRDVPYTARCSFAEGRMDLNVDGGFSRSAMKHLVAHEIFPGHATQILYTRARVGEGRAPTEALLCTANTVLGCVQEGIGDEAVELIDWVEDADDALQVEVRRLRSAAQTSAAWYLMHDGWTAGAVTDWLRDVAAGQPSWIDGRLRMAAHPFRGPFIASYWAGAVAVRTVRERTPASRQRAFIEYLYENAHSPASLALFDGGVEPAVS